MVRNHDHGMEHHHIVDIHHGHTINDPGHAHSYDKGYAPGHSANHPGNNVFYDADQPYDTSKVATGITVNSEPATDRYKYSGGSVSDQQGTLRVKTDGNDNYGIENRPSNFTVKIWKRIA